MISTPSVRVGPAGWSYADWEGVVYPPHGSRFDPLAYLTEYFDTIEINSTFYRIPPPTHAQSWVRRVRSNPHFRFTVKLFRGFTHENAIQPGDAEAFARALDPMLDAERLGAVLIQFPWSFKETSETRKRLLTLFRKFSRYPLAVELRHATFQNEQFLALLREEGVAWVNIDQPLFADSVKPSAEMTANLAYVRFHGRNYEKWFAHEHSWERYDYLYTRDELAPWVRRIQTMAEQNDVYVITNNHFRGQAIVNAIDLKRAVGQSAEVPPPLAAAYSARLP